MWIHVFKPLLILSFAQTTTNTITQKTPNSFSISFLLPSTQTPLLPVVEIWWKLKFKVPDSCFGELN
ncbi:hypothetical protein HanPI659440_Chr02g0038191 [Helianthus annuus]|nr:hypothetical protein HanPI659440_Chr02g0038191 [Helianthus annuus]